ncbi:uncharacterized protein [Emydura macquarii macquarii]|uniref:uncharacterized protein isoform X2 n=1 Tax=Emydura macquarii macquarii TaxID=1129001 RepID=UPI00352AADA2
MAETRRNCPITSEQGAHQARPPGAHSCVAREGQKRPLVAISGGDTLPGPRSFLILLRQSLAPWSLRPVHPVGSRLSLAAPMPLAMTSPAKPLSRPAAKGTAVQGNRCPGTGLGSWTHVCCGEQDPRPAPSCTIAPPPPASAASSARGGNWKGRKHPRLGLSHFPFQSRDLLCPSSAGLNTYFCVRPLASLIDVVEENTAFTSVWVGEEKTFITRDPLPQTETWPPLGCSARGGGAGYPGTFSPALRCGPSGVGRAGR